MPTESKKLGIGCLMIIVIIWNLFVLGFDAINIYELNRQFQARNTFIPVQATVISASVKSTQSSSGISGSSSSVYTPVIEYKYAVNGTDYTNDRYSFLIWNRANPEYAQSIINKYPTNSQLTIYHDPFDPSRSIVDRTFGEYPAVMALFLLPFHCVGIIGVLFIIRLSRYKSLQGDQRFIAPYIVYKDQQRTKLRDFCSPLWLVFFCTLGITSFVMIFVLLIASQGFETSPRAVLVTLIGCLCIAILNTIRKAVHRADPRRSLVIEHNNQDFTRGAHRFATESVEKITVDSFTKSKNNKEAWYKHTAIANLNDNSTVDLLVTKGPKGHARILKRVLKKELGI